VPSVFFAGLCATGIMVVMRVFLVILGLLAAAAGQDYANQLSTADKLIVVTTPDWNAVSGTLTRYQRKRGKWKAEAKPISIVVGKTGLAWDPRLAKGHADAFPGPVKHEGDGKSPAGIFGIPNTFGFAPSLGSSPMYITLTPTTECVDDASSRHYTQIVDRLNIRDADWNSSERMRGVPGYRQGAVVDYNMNPPVPGDGSCIFLHIWSGPGQGTVGCTAMPAGDVERLVSWIETKGTTALVQLPEEEYQRLKSGWNLP